MMNEPIMFNVSSNIPVMTGITCDWVNIYKP